MGNVGVPPGRPAIEGGEGRRTRKAFTVLGVKSAFHGFVSTSCTFGKEGTGADCGYEQRSEPKSQSSNREHSGQGGGITAEQSSQR